jgi:hypothetical protein
MAAKDAMGSPAAVASGCLGTRARATATGRRRRRRRRSTTITQTQRFRFVVKAEAVPEGSAEGPNTEAATTISQEEGVGGDGSVLGGGNSMTVMPSVDEIEFDSINELVDKKLELLELVSGSDRGFAFFKPEQRLPVEKVVEELCEIGSKPDRKSKLRLSEGMWRLVYSTNFTSNQGIVSQPFLGIPKLGQVYQRITPTTVDNIVELELPVVSTVRATLGHSLRIGPEEEFVITYKYTNVRLVAGVDTNVSIPNVLTYLPESIRPGNSVSSAAFKNIFIDSTMRISRGELGELRIYIFAPEAA